MALGADMSSVLFGRLAFAVAATALVAACLKTLSDETFFAWAVRPPNPIAESR